MALRSKQRRSRDVWAFGVSEIRGREGESTCDLFLLPDWSTCFNMFECVTRVGGPGNVVAVVECAPLWGLPTPAFRG